MYVIDFKNILYLCSQDTTEKPLRTKFLISSNQTTTMGLLVNLIMHTDIVRTMKSGRLQVDTGEYKTPPGQKIHNFSHTYI